MRKHTLVENIKPDPHTYLVTIGTDIGQFTGAVECRAEDWQYESQYFGFELAELKAEIAYARAKRNEYNAQLAALTQFWREMSTTRTFDENAYWVKKMRSRIDDIDYKILYWRDRVSVLKQMYYNKIQWFDDTKVDRNRFLIRQGVIE